MRLHNVIRKAGDVINAVPDEAVIETKVRAASLDAIRATQEKWTALMTELPMHLVERLKENRFRDICRSCTEVQTK